MHDAARILCDRVSIRFKLSLDKPRTLREHFALAARRLLGYRPTPFAALQDITFAAYDGESIGVVGANGGGKSTLLRAVAGIYSPDDGSLRVQGKISALLSLGSGFDAQLSGRDNIYLNGLTLGLTRKEIAALLPGIVEFSGVGKFIDAPLKYFSSGMVGRLSFSIALAMQPDILLLDEIFGVGDLEFREKSAQAMRDMLGKAGCRLLVTHNLHLVLEQCTRALYINQGRLVLDADPATVIAAYRQDVAKKKATR